MNGYFQTEQQAAYVYAYFLLGQPIYVGVGRSGERHRIPNNRALKNLLRKEADKIQFHKIAEGELSAAGARLMATGLLQSVGRFPNGTLLNGSECDLVE